MELTIRKKFLRFLKNLGDGTENSEKKANWTKYLTSRRRKKTTQVRFATVLLSQCAPWMASSAASVWTLLLAVEPQCVATVSVKNASANHC